MNTFVTIIINATLVLAFLTALGLAGVFIARFVSGNVSDYRADH